MTTNHPEVLDPALVRPGRIGKTLELSCMVASDAIDMLEHYFAAKLDETERSRLAAFVYDGITQITPAVMEQYILEMDSVADMLTSIEQKGKSAKSLVETSDSTTAYEPLLEEGQSQEEGEPYYEVELA
jgi:ATP-dependent 26S proteasome regulatory subunit